MVYSHKKIGQPGPLTRILSCKENEWEAMSEEAKSIVTTHVAPSYSTHPRTGDTYPAYNKPVAVIDWLAKNKIEEDYILIIDADMIMRRKIVPDELGAAKGLAISAHFGYMIGVANELADKHIPDVAPREDAIAGPVGRKGDQAGGFTLMEASDLRKVAPMWLKYTEDVRGDPDAWKLTGDQYSRKPGDKPWISEMYGYSFACAKADVWHKTPSGMMLYPGYDVTEIPHVLHYGLLWTVKQEGKTAYEFDKHWFYGFDPFVCPPWDLEKQKPSGGLFPHVPSPSSFKTSGFALLKDLLSIEVPITLNAALCERHQRNCDPSPELERECARAKSYETLFDERIRHLVNSLPDNCVDMHEKCEMWAKEGECTNNANYMFKTCRKACKKCIPQSSIHILAEETEEDEYLKIEQNEGDEYDTHLNDDNSNAYDPEHTAEEEEWTVVQKQMEARKQKEEEEARKQKEEEEARKQKEEEARKQMEEEAQKKKEQEEAQKKKEQEEAQKAEFDAQQREFEQVMIPKLQERCKKYPSWTRSQVDRCLSFAEDGIEYDPLIFDFEDSDIDGSNPFIINLDSADTPFLTLSSGKSIILAVALLSVLTWKNRRFIKSRIIKISSKRKGHHLG
jgi:hypothetical protein